MMNCGNKKSKIKYSFEVHSFKHLYNNYTIYDLVNYVLYLQTIYFNIYSIVWDIRLQSADKSYLIRCIRDIELSLTKLTNGGFSHGND